MVEKLFKIISNSEEFLTQEKVAEALLQQITLKDKTPTIFFGVIEWKPAQPPQDAAKPCLLIR